MEPDISRLSHCWCWNTPAYSFLGVRHVNGHMDLIASAAVSLTPRAIGWSLKLSTSCNREFSRRNIGTDLFDHTVMIDQGFGNPAIERWLRQIA